MMNQDFDPYEILTALEEHAVNVSKQLELMAQTHSVMIDEMVNLNQRITKLELEVNDLVNSASDRKRR